MGRYLHGGVNITGFQLLDPESKQLEEFMDVWARLDKHTYPGAGTHKLTVLLFIYLFRTVFIIIYSFICLFLNLFIIIYLLEFFTSHTFI